MAQRSDPDALLARLQELYMDLHAHPELSFAEHRTSGIAAKWLQDNGYSVVESIGGTGAAGVLTTGPGPVVLLRADMDGLPVLEQPWPTGSAIDLAAGQAVQDDADDSTGTGPGRRGQVGLDAPRQQEPPPSKPSAHTSSGSRGTLRRRHDQHRRVSLRRGGDRSAPDRPGCGATPAPLIGSSR